MKNWPSNFNGPEPKTHKLKIQEKVGGFRIGRRGVCDMTLIWKVWGQSGLYEWESAYNLRKSENITHSGCVCIQRDRESNTVLTLHMAGLSNICDHELIIIIIIIKNCPTFSHTTTWSHIWERGGGLFCYYDFFFNQCINIGSVLVWIW